jgi:hypothetical protein
MTAELERFVERAFDRLFEQASDAADRARREAARGGSSDRAFEDGRVLTYYEVIGELWLLAKEAGLHEQGLGAPEWHPDDVSLLQRQDPDTQERIRTTLQFASRSDLEAQANLQRELSRVREAIGDRFAGTWIQWERDHREWHVAVVDPTAEDVSVVASAAHRAGFVPFVRGVRYSSEEVEAFRLAVAAVVDRAPSGLIGFGPDPRVNGVSISLGEPTANVLSELLATVPKDAAEFEVRSSQAIAGWTTYASLEDPRALKPRKSPES